MIPVDGESILAPKLKLIESRILTADTAVFDSYEDTHDRLIVLVTATASPLGPMTDVCNVP